MSGVLSESVMGITSILVMSVGREVLADTMTFTAALGWWTCMREGGVGRRRYLQPTRLCRPGQDVRVHREEAKPSISIKDYMMP